MITAAIIDVSPQPDAMPELALERLGGRTVLSHAIARARRIPGVNRVVAALCKGADPELAEDARAAGALVATGPGDDALGRACAAAHDCGAARVVSLRASHAFFDPVVAGGVLALMNDARADVASNTLPALFPHGLDCEAVYSDLLHQADAKAASADERADPNLWIRRQPGLVCANLNGPGGGLESLRWVIEREADLLFFQAVFAALGPRASDATAAEIAALCLRRPDIAAINAPCADTRRLASPERAGVQSAPVRFMLAS
jgi:spore coat polysaccharide biosynthesis protein SpsF (cytidylyltransferase family)